jgi:glucose-6-phosphate 1-dehydrogenase
MAETKQVVTMGAAASGTSIGGPPKEGCIMVIFGASGDLTKRLLMPAIYNLECDGLLPAHFAIIGTAMDGWSTQDFRDRMTHEIKTFSTRKVFDQAAWDRLVKRLHYTPGKFDDKQAFAKLYELVGQLNSQLQADGNVLFYMATPPSVFGLISDNLDKAGFKQFKGWKRIIVEKPFGTDLSSALQLNREILSYWDESQIFRIDHYLGKETVQNILAFRFSNEIFEPLWNKNHIDHIQFTVSEAVGVEGRGRYYDKSGVLRDMMQNHMFQMLAYLCMEPPSSFSSDAIRNEKAKVLQAVRVLKPEEVPLYTVRGQYGPGKKPDGTPTVGYRQEPDIKEVNPQSKTETFAAMRLAIDNWRWEGVPIYLRSGKALSKRGTEIVVQFKKAPLVIFRDTPIHHLASNRLIFHIQPDQAIELLFQAKHPGPTLWLQNVNMRFSYAEAFQASRATGYEVMLYSCMIGDATLFSRTDLVETAWRIAQPILDYWAAAPAEFPNYDAGTWGPKAAFELIGKDGRRWFEIINREMLEQIPLFKGCDAVFLNSVVTLLRPQVFRPGEIICHKGADPAREMYLIARGQVEIVDGNGKVINTLGDGHCFGEIGVLLSQPRTATVRAISDCDLFVLQKEDFLKLLAEQPRFKEAILEIVRTRYNLTLTPEQLKQEQPR